MGTRGSDLTEVGADAEGFPNGDGQGGGARPGFTDVWWADASGRLLADLPAWRDHTGQRLDELLGSGWIEAVRHDHRDAVASAWAEAVATGTPLHAQFPIVSPHGAERLVVVRAQPVARGGDDPHEWFGTVTGFERREEAVDVWLEVRMAETLRRIGAALVSELDLERVVQHVTDAAMELVGAEFGAFFPRATAEAGAGERGEGSVLSAVSAETLVGDGRVLEAMEAMLGGGAVLRLDDTARDPRFGPAPPGSPPVRSCLAVPVVSRTGERLGGLFFGHSRAGAFTGQHERLVAGLAAPAAIAIDNARLYRTVQRERDVAQRLADRLAQMQAVSAKLAGAKVVDEVAEVVVSGSVNALGCDRASMYLLDEHGSALRLVHAVGYEGKWLDRWARISSDARLPVTEALRSRRLVFITGERDWSERYPEMGSPSERSVALAVIPLALGGQVFGVAAFGWDGDRTVEDDEVAYLGALADQCSQALERARLYEVEREVARTLQRSLLPPGTPEIPGMEVAAVFRAGDRSVAVGGDFYDVFRLGANRWGIAMGDVCGRGAQAASRTALVRYTVRALAGRLDGPAGVLRGLNQALIAEPDADDRFCATVFAVVELDRCGAWVTLACAGHPRPVVVRRAGWIDLRGQPGTLAGVLDELDVSEDRVGLGPGDALVFFTDGISEARNARGEQFADEALPDTLLASHHLHAAGTALGLRRAALDFSGGSLGDDLAILVLRVPPEAADDPDGRLRAALGDALDEAPGYPVPYGGITARPFPPREARIELPPHPVSAGAARRFLTAVLRSWRMPEELEADAVLLLSELATNAILHARSAFTVIVRFDGANLRVEVGDGSRAEPRVRLLHPGAVPGGRGLRVIDSVSQGWGILPTARGKRVWFELPVPD